MSGDGTVLFNGLPVISDCDGDGTGITIIAIPIGMLLPAVQDAVGLVTAFIPGGPGGPRYEIRQATFRIVEDYSPRPTDRRVCTSRASTVAAG